eukprot:Skav221196  [mRNA]  locus=scaffold3557:162377:162781:- [translate_table: standard]
MEEFIGKNPAFRAWTWMGAYGAASPKGTTLWSSRPSAHKFCRALPQRAWHSEITKKSVLRSGKISVSGGRDLKGSQSYTSEFGFSTLSVWLQEKPLPMPDVSNVRVPTFWGTLPKKERWDDANLAEVMQYLTLN